MEKTDYIEECSQCGYRKLRNKNGNCGRYLAHDGFPAKCTSFWAGIKRKAVDVYSGIFVGSMKAKWTLNYLDLYAGPGKYFDRSTGQLLDSSALIALKYDYNRIILNDLDNENYDALFFRTNDDKDRISIFNVDANKIESEIAKYMGTGTLSFCFLDPSNMNDLSFETVKAISKGRRVDFLINFAFGMDFRRFKHMSERKLSSYDGFFGTNRWRAIVQKFENGDIQSLGKAILDLYFDQLESIDYLRPNDSIMHLTSYRVHNSKKTLLYYLILASKHSRGNEFFAKIRPYVEQQQELFNRPN